MNFLFFFTFFDTVANKEVFPQTSFNKQIGQYLYFMIALILDQALLLQNNLSAPCNHSHSFMELIS